MRKVTLRTDKSFAEIYSSGLEYSLLNKDLVAYHAPVFCKDFFTDVFWSESHKQATTIHGFSWKPGMLDPRSSTFAMALGYKGKTLNAGRIQAFLNAFEDRFRMPTSRAFEANDGLVVVLFNKAWTVRPVLISLVTALMRLAPGWDGTGPVAFVRRIASKGNPYGVYDSSEFSKAGVLTKLQECWDSRSLPHPNQTYGQYDSPFKAHHSGGFIAFTTGRPTG